MLSYYHRLYQTLHAARHADPYSERGERLSRACNWLLARIRENERREFARACAMLAHHDLTGELLTGVELDRLVAARESFSPNGTS